MEESDIETSVTELEYFAADVETVRLDTVELESPQGEPTTATAGGVTTEVADTAPFIDAVPALAGGVETIEEVKGTEETETDAGTEPEKTVYIRRVDSPYLMAEEQWEQTKLGHCLTNKTNSSQRGCQLSLRAQTAG